MLQLRTAQSSPLCCSRSRYSGAACSHSPDSRARKSRSWARCPASCPYQLLLLSTQLTVSSVSVSARAGPGLAWWRLLATSWLMLVPGGGRLVAATTCTPLSTPSTFTRILSVTTRRHLQPAVA